MANRRNASAAYWVRCALSSKLADAVGDEFSETIYSAYGTVAHELAANALLGGKRCYELHGHTVQQGRFSVTVDDTMMDIIDSYVAYVHRASDEIDGCQMLIEQQVDVSPVVGQTRRGFVDCMLIGKYLWHFIDLKGGRGHTVPANNNPQLRIYAKAALEQYRFIYDRPKQVKLSIVQPQKDWYESEVVDLDELDEYSRETIQKAALRSSDPDDLEGNPGDWCRFCPGRFCCPALEQATSALVPAPTLNAKQLVVEMDNESLGQLCDRVEFIDFFTKAVKAEVGRRLHESEAVPGWTLVEGRSNRAWSEDDETMRKRFALLGFDDIDVKPKLASPAEMERRYGTDDIKGLWTKPPGKETLAPIGDARDRAIDKTSQALADFGTYIEDDS